jgi:hypothetical protein
MRQAAAGDGRYCRGGGESRGREEGGGRALSVKNEGKREKHLWNTPIHLD